MANPLPYSVPETEPTEDEVRKWQAELDRDRRAADRTPVSMILGEYELPLVVSRDGSVHQLTMQIVGEGQREYTWLQLPPIPGSPAALSGEYYPLTVTPADEPMFGSDDAAKPFLCEDEDGRSR